MKFILSKVLLFLLFPITWVFALLLLSLIVKNLKKKMRFFIAGLVVFYIFSIPLFLDLWAKYWDYPPAPLTNKSYSAVIVLGGFSGVNKQSGQGMFNGASDRFIRGVQLYATGKTPRILITSGNGSLFPGNFREASWAHRQLRFTGVPDSAILIENQSRNTIENALFSKKLLESKHISGPYILVTSAFHMRRSMLIFKKAGLDVVPFPCNYIANTRRLGFDSFLPDSYVFDNWNYYTKELVGYVVAWLSKIG